MTRAGKDGIWTSDVTQRVSTSSEFNRNLRRGPTGKLAQVAGKEADNDTMTKVTHLMFPKVATTCQYTTRFHHGQRDETELTPHRRSPVLLQCSTLESWPFLVLLLVKKLARGRGWVYGKARTQTGWTMTILAMRALLRDALEERAALTALRAGFWQNMGLLSPPSLGSGVSVASARSTFTGVLSKSGRDGRDWAT